MHSWPDPLLDSLSADTVVLDGAGGPWTAAMLHERIALLRATLEQRSAPQAPVAILADNSPDWLAVDLCTRQMGLTLVPLPLFFTPAQWLHVIAESGVQAVFCAQPQQAASLGFTEVVGSAGALALCQKRDAAPAPGLDGVQKITFTSGTTSTPKGVCLSAGQQADVASALHAGLASLGLRRHLCLLPFAVLLENIAGPYTALLSGATTICPPLAEVGMSGSSGFDPQRCLDAVARYGAHSIIVLPQMLQALVAAAKPGDARMASLRFVAVGGAKTPAGLLAAAARAGFPVYEGYGLSECSSVVALNLPGASRPGTVGRALSGRSLRIAPDGEIEIGGVLARYLGQPEAGAMWLATGDLGHLDADGFLTIDGRKKDILITGFGRNVSPEWPEAALSGTGRVAQSLVVGDGQPYLAALIVPLPSHDSMAEIQAAVDLANAGLPDYARITRWQLAAPFTTANGQATANGRPRRASIQHHYRQHIAALFDATETI
ncbi:AMP-binding protein [Massilia soli]|uniref:AMP-binding protein n=1 Tax=Massilia soli TaxID=2792854 RepID=A0ABS7SUY9_9BURK|nr:AMP-binding protein [Massilia soli]MBZ2209769.1 AMP-binding protein [Massilia soli]